MKLKRIITLFISAVTLLTCMPLDALAVQTPETEPAQTGMLESNMSVNGTNSFGELLADELNGEYSEQQENNGCNVFSAEVTDKTVSVEFETTTEGTLLAAIYDEAGEQMLASGSVEVTAEETKKDVTIETDSMPQYFYLRVFLVDTLTLRPLCTAYESPNYTQEMQEFLAKTVDDFAPEKVLNLDEDKTNNFAVYGENTVTAESSGDVNKVVSSDESTETYVIENPDSTITGLKNGDILACEQENMEVLIVKVESIEISGDTATITGQDTSMEDVFDYVKIDSSQQAGEADYDPSTLSEGITYEGFGEFEQQPMLKSRSFGVIEDEGVVPVGISLNVNMAKAGGFSLTGGLKYSAEFSMKLYLSLKRQFIEFKIDSTLAINLTLTGKISEKIKLGTFDMMIFPGVNVGIVPKFITEASVSFSTTGTLTATVGFGYEHTKKKNNFYSLTTKPKYKDTMTLEGKLEFGLELEPNVSIISSKLVRLGFTGSATVEISLARVLYDSEAATQKDKYHECKVCFAGGITVGFGVSIDLTFLDSDKLKLSKDLVGKDFKIADLYYSVDHNDYNYGTCPWQQFRVTLVALGEDMQPLSGASVKIDDEEETYMTDTGGVVRFYLPGESTHKVTVEDPDSGMIREKKIKVERSPECVYMWMLDNSYHQGGGGSIGNVVKEEPYDPTKVTVKSMKFSIITEDGETPYARLDQYLGDEKHVVIPETVNGYTVKGIDSYAFDSYYVGNRYCYDKTESVTIPSGMKFIDANAFYSDNIKNIYVSEQNQNFCEIDGVLFNKERTVLIRYPRGRNEAEYVIPETVEYIGESAFEWCKLSSVKFPDKLTNIGKSAFESCENLTSVNFPDSLTKIGDNAFDWCDGLTEVTIPDSVTELGGYSFGRCSNLKSVHIGSGVTSLWFRTFDGCYNLETVTLPDGLTEMSDHVFADCEKLKSIKIPDSVNSISFDVFEGSGVFDTSIDGIVYADNWAVGYTEDCSGKLNFKAGTRGIAGSSVPESVSITEINLPDGLKHISSRAFIGCDITNINIPESVENISQAAFSSCKNLKTVTLHEGLRAIDVAAFSSCESLESINIPDSVIFVGDDAFRYSGVETADEYGIRYVDNWVTNFFPTNHIKYEEISGSVIPIREGTVGIAAGGMDDTYPGYKSVVLPDGLKYICDSNFPDNTFSFSKRDTSITIPKSVEYIGCNSGLFNISDIYYKGTHEQWSKIKTYYDMEYSCCPIFCPTLDDAVNNHGFWLDNNECHTAVHYNSTGPELEADPPTLINTSRISLNADETTEDITEETNPNLTQTEFKNLLPNETYNFYVLKDDTAENLLGSDNLLYIDQYTSDADGNVTAEYIPREDYYKATAFLVRMSPIQLTAENTSVTADDLICTYEEPVVKPVVIYDGRELVPGIDYELKGDFSAVSEGEYTAMIVGKGNYSGEVEFTYKMTCQHEWQDGMCSICGKECIHEIVDGVCTICGKAEEADFLLGDANNDGKISAVDASIIFSEYKKIYRDGVGTFTDEDILRCDSNGDGKITAVDASYAFSEYKRIYRENSL